MGRGKRWRRRWPRCRARGAGRRGEARPGAAAAPKSMRHLKAFRGADELSRRRADRGAAGRLRRDRRRAGAAHAHQDGADGAGRPPARRRPLRGRRSVRDAVRSRAPDLAAPVRARARRLARPRPGDGRPAALYARRGSRSPATSSPTTCRRCSSTCRRDPRPRRARCSTTAHTSSGGSARRSPTAAATTRRCSRRCSGRRRRGPRQRQGQARTAAEEKPLDEEWAEEPVVFGPAAAPSCGVPQGARSACARRPADARPRCAAPLAAAPASPLENRIHGGTLHELPAPVRLRHLPVLVGRCFSPAA